jgi:hypothetical protein
MCLFFNITWHYFTAVRKAFGIMYTDKDIPNKVIMHSDNKIPVQRDLLQQVIFPASKSADRCYDHKVEEKLPRL